VRALANPPAGLRALRACGIAAISVAMANIQIRTGLADPEQAQPFIPHRPERPQKS